MLSEVEASFPLFQRGIKGVSESSSLHFSECQSDTCLLDNDKLLMNNLGLINIRVFFT